MFQKSKHEDVKPDKDLLDTKMQSKRSEVLAKEREERFARLSAWKVSWCFHTKLLRSIYIYIYISIAIIDHLRLNKRKTIQN